MPVKAPKNQTKLPIKVIILGIVDLICIGILVVFLSNLPEKAAKLKNLRSLKHKAIVVNLGTIQTEIVTTKKKADRLKTLFPDETGLINFVNEIDKLRNEGRVTHFSFVSDKVIKDKTQVPGLPFVIESRSSWSELDVTLQKIEKLPFLIRAVDIEIKQLSEDQVLLKYGGVLYVDESFYPAPP